MTNKIIKADGSPRFGIFEDSITEINAADYDYRSPMGRKYGRMRRYTDFNQFQYYGVIADDLIFGCALADTKFLGIAFVYVYQPSSGELIEYNFKTPAAVGFSMNLSPIEGTSSLLKGKNRMELINQAEPREKRLKVSLKKGLEIDAVFSETNAAFEPMNICTPTGYSGWVFAQKVAGVAVTGTIESPVGSFDLAQINAHGHHDYSAGYMRHETWWNWACLSGELPSGEKIGLNVSRGVNETGCTENCMWLDGKLIKIDFAQFEFDRMNPEKTWRVYSNDKIIDLDFQPEGMHKEKVNAGFLAGNFKQIFGKFKGTVKVPGKKSFVIKDLYGFVEDQYAKW